jgi:hypothetical protein
MCWIEHNNGGTPGGGVRRYGESSVPPNVGLQNAFVGVYTYNFTAGDTLQAAIYITVNGNVLFGSGPTELSSFYITRLY